MCHNIFSQSVVCLFFVFFFLPHHTACRILVPDQGSNLCPPTVEGQILNHWTTREVPLFIFLMTCFKEQMF